MLVPPMKSMASSTTRVVILVLSDRPTLSIMLRLTMGASSRSGCRETFSRMRSNTTIVSFTL